MGKPVWNDLARLVALTAATYAVWADIWAIAFPKFMFDMIGGTLGPHGIIPPKSSSFFNFIIVKLPIVQIVSIVFSLFALAVEWPIKPLVARVPYLHRSFIFRYALFLWNAFLSIMLYQGTNAALYYLVAIIFYSLAHKKNEKIQTVAPHMSIPAKRLAQMA